MSNGEDVFDVVFVCTGNRARSALAEALFRRYSHGIHTAVSSAGTLDVGSVPPLVDAVDAGRRLGVDLTGHRARVLRDMDLAAADLVLGFEHAHVAAAVVDAHADPARAFLLGEFVMLLDAAAPGPDPLERARAAVANADLRRTRYRPNPTALVLRDPLGRSARQMRRTATEIDRLVREVVRGLFGDLDQQVVARPKSR